MCVLVLKEPDTVIDPEDKLSISKEDAVIQAIASFQLVFTHGPKIELDHFLVYFARKSFRPPTSRHLDRSFSLELRLDLPAFRGGFFLNLMSFLDPLIPGFRLRIRTVARM